MHPFTAVHVKVHNSKQQDLTALDSVLTVCLALG